MRGLLSRIMGVIATKNFSSEKAVLKSVSGSVVDEEIHDDNYNIILRSGSFRDVFFVDGGDAGLLVSSSFALGFFRACTIRMKSNDYSVFHAEEMFCAALPEKDFFVLEASPPKNFLDGLKIIPVSQDLLGSGAAWSACSQSRRLLELSLVLKAVSGNKNALVVLDGSLDCGEGEEQVLSGIRGAAQKNNCVVLGLSKSNSFSTDMKRPLGYALSERRKGPWYYTFRGSPSPDFSVCFAKLHSDSTHVFRIDFFPEQKSLLSEAILFLSECSDDPVFFGYPYGLVEADNFARVSSSEKEGLLESLRFEAGDAWGKLEKASGNVHEVLDSLKF